MRSSKSKRRKNPEKSDNIAREEERDCLVLGQKAEGTRGVRKEAS